MKIRRMIIDDYDKVYALWTLCKGMGLNDLDDSKEGIERFLNRNPDTCFVAVNNGRIQGVILAGNDGRRGYIHHTAVRPDYRMQGIASRLVKMAMEALKNCGIHKAALVVFDKNLEGNQFWEKMGFSVREDLIYRNKVITETTRTDI